MTENRRVFFEKYAANNGFDPRIPSNWYSRSREKIKSIPVSSSSTLPSPSPYLSSNFFSQGAMQVISYHNYSVSRALIELFPEVPLLLTSFKVDKSLVLEKSTPPFSPLSILCPLFQSFSSRPSLASFLSLNYLIQAPWYYTENRKNFFLNYAKENGFDALVAENWYLQSRTRIKSQKVLPLSSSSISLFKFVAKFLGREQKEYCTTTTEVCR